MSKIKISYCNMSEFNSIFLIDCLKTSDLQTGRRRHEDIHDEINEKIYDKNGNHTEDSNPQILKKFRESDVEHKQIFSLSELENIFSTIKSKSRDGAKYLLFIDGHGHKETGLELNSQEYASWDFLIRNFREITQNSGGHLTVIAAFCFSSLLIDRVEETCSYKAKDRLPFAFYYGYKNEICAGKIQDDTKLIFKDFFQNGGANTEKLIEEQMSDRIRKYSEFDYAIPIVYYLMEILKPNCEGSGFKKFKADAIGVIRDIFPSHKESRECLKKIDKFSLLEGCLNDCMYDSPRRKNLLEDLKKQYSNTPFLKNSSNGN